MSYLLHLLFLATAFWQAFSKSVGRSGSGARKLEVAVFAAMASVAIVGMLSVDTLWEYKNKGGMHAAYDVPT